MSGPAGVTSGPKAFDLVEYEASEAAKISGRGHLSSTIVSLPRNTPEDRELVRLEQERRIAVASKLKPEERESTKTFAEIFAERRTKQAADDAAKAAAARPVEAASPAAPAGSPAKTEAAAAASAENPQDDINLLKTRSEAQGRNITGLKATISSLEARFDQALVEKDRAIAKLTEINAVQERVIAALREQFKIDMAEELRKEGVKNQAYFNKIMMDMARINIRLGLAEPTATATPTGPSAAALPAPTVSAVGVSARPTTIAESRWQGPGSAS